MTEGADASIDRVTADSRAPEGGRASDANVFREEARREGFLRSGIARAGEPPGFPRFSAWLASGMHAGMRYLAETRQARADPAQILPGARSIVCLSAEYSAAPHRSADGAVFARYARGADYHGTLRQRAEGVARSAALRIGRPFAYRVCVDTTPLAERSFAAAAGLGWIGKNGCVIDPERGSYLLLAEIVTDLDLPPDDPVAEQCGSCARCLQACPTQAFPSPGIVDASRCLAYWTIEHRGPFPDPVKAAVADRLFGCDICQEVCPWNGGASEPAPAEPPPTRAEWLAMGPGQWRRRFARSAFNRAGRRGMQRNAAASAGSSGDRALLPALRRAAGAQEAGLSDAAAWAAARLDAG
jgi:epoxyqueuosine reductase